MSGPELMNGLRGCINEPLLHHDFLPVACFSCIIITHARLQLTRALRFDYARPFRTRPPLSLLVFLFACVLAISLPVWPHGLTVGFMLHASCLALRRRRCCWWQCQGLAACLNSALAHIRTADKEVGRVQKLALPGSAAVGRILSRPGCPRPILPRNQLLLYLRRRPECSANKGSAMVDAVQELLLAETIAYKAVDQKILSHTAGTVVKETVQLFLVPGGEYKLVCTAPGGSAEEYTVTADDWELGPQTLDHIGASVHTEKAPDAGPGQVLMQGEFLGEDLPLYDIQIKWRSSLKNFLLHPNTAGATHKRPAGQAKLVRLGFEQLQEAQEWYSLLALAMGLIDDTAPQLERLPTARAASLRIKSMKSTA